MSDPWAPKPEREASADEPTTPLPPPTPPAAPYTGQYGGQQQYGSPPQPQDGPPQYGPPQGYGAPPYGGPSYGGYGYGQPPPYGRNSGKATTVMVLGISSLALMVTTGLGFIAAIVALVLARGAQREIAESGGLLGGESQIRTGRITSWITLGFTALAVVFLVVLIVALVATRDLG